MKENRLIYRDVGGLGDKIFDLQIVGGGPAGCGPLVAAAKHRKLDELLRSGGGVALIEGRRQSLGQGAFENYGIFSNSPARDFLEAFEEDEGQEPGEFADILQTSIARRFTDYRAQGLETVHLKEVADLQKEVARRVEAAFGRNPNSQILNSKIGFVRRVTQDGVPLYLSHEADNPDRIVAASRNILLATGGLQKPRLELDELNANKRILSDEIIGNGPKLNEIVATLKSNPGAKVTIVGALHSGFSAAWKILEALKNQNVTNVSDGAIQIVARHQVRLFYDSVVEARAARYNFDPEDVCQRTGRVYRFGGIRGESRKLYLDVANGRERKVEVIEGCDQGKLDALCHQATFIVEAIGYQANRIPILGEDRQEIGPKLSENGRFVDVDPDCRLYDHRGIVIPGAFAMGLGHGIAAGDEGEKSFNGLLDAVNLYQTLLGRKILEAILAFRR